MRKKSNCFGWAGVGAVALLICAFFFTQIVYLAFAACTNTTNMAMCKPSIGQSGWGTSINTNLDIIDAQLPAFSAGDIKLTVNATCGTGFTEYITARGRFLVGVPNAGTNEGTVGSALTDLQDKTHTHTYTDVPNHVHSVNPPSTSVSVTDPGHTHPIPSASNTAGALKAAQVNNDQSTNFDSVSNTTGITASVDVAAFNSANPTGGVATGTTATTALSTSWPYIQLRLCKKS